MKLTKKWLKAALVRAVRTFAQSLLSMLTVGMMITDLDWYQMLDIASTAFVISILTSITGLPEVGEDDEDD